VGTEVDRWQVGDVAGIAEHDTAGLLRLVVSLRPEAPLKQQVEPRARIEWRLHKGLQDNDVAIHHGTVHYRCRLDVGPRCGEGRVREKTLDAWAESLFEALGTLDEAAVEKAREQARKAPQGPRRQSVEGVEAALGRLQKLYGWGQLTDDQYQAERRNMEALRDELLRSEPIPDLVERIRGVGESWRQGGPLTRRACWASSSSTCTRVAGAWCPMWPGESTGQRSRKCSIWCCNLRRMAGREGFEPSRELQTPYPLSRRALSTTQPPPREPQGRTPRARVASVYRAAA
jgi:hypothetical protein